MILYKYLIPDRVDVIRNRMIRISQPGALNDPFEMSFTVDRLFAEKRALIKYVSITKAARSIEEGVDKMFASLSEEELSNMRARFEEHGFQFDRRLMRTILVEALFNKQMDFRARMIERVRETGNELIGLLCLSILRTVFLNLNRVI